MTNKELKSLSRADLLEMLLNQSREMEALQAKLQEAQTQLESRSIAVNSAGSIAEASLQLNGVFEAAQKAADQYLENVLAYSRQQDEAFHKMDAERLAKFEQQVKEDEEKHAAMEAEANERCAAMEAEMQKKCAAMEAETQDKCAAMVARAEADAKVYWDEVSVKLEQFYDAHEGLRDLLMKIIPVNG